MKKAVIIYFAAYFVIGLLILPDYGISIDEPFERNTSVVTSAYIARSISDAMIRAGLPGFDMPDIPDFTEYKDKYYGTALHYHLVLAEVISGFNMDSRAVYLLRHLNVFIFFYLALICFYLLIKERFDSRRAGLAGVVFLSLYPRFFAEAFYNNKDILFASCYIIAAYFGIKFYKKPSYTAGLAAAAALAFTMNTRIVGFFCALGLLIIFGIRFCAQKDREHIKPLLFYCVCAFCIFIAISPGYWSVNPFASFIDALRMFSRFPYPYDVYFLGSYYNSAELPRYYIPVYIAATVPVFYIALFFAGIAAKINDMVKERNFTGGNGTDTLMFLSFALPLLYVVILTPPLYNAWRHMYFIFPPMVYYCVYGLNKLYSYFKTKNPHAAYAFTAIVLAAVFGQVFWIINNHPFQYVYYNPIGKITAERGLDKDYWQVSGKQALEYILDTTDGDIPLARKSYPSLLLLNQDDRKRFIGAYVEKPDVFAGRPGVGGSGVYNMLGGDYFIHFHTEKGLYIPGFRK